MPELKELDDTYTMKLAALDDPTQKAAVELEWQKARGEFLQNELERTHHDQWRQQALTKYPYASPAEVVGKTQEEFEAHAKQSHESFDAKIKEAVAAKDKEIEELKAKQAWGSPTAGGGAPANAQSTDGEIDAAWKGIREENLTRQQASRLQKLRMGAILDDKIESLKTGPTK